MEVILKLNKLLKWKSVWNWEKTVETTTNWYKNFYENNELNTIGNLNSFIIKYLKIKRSRNGYE